MRPGHLPTTATCKTWVAACVCVCVGGWSTFSQKGVKEGGRERLSPKEPGGVRFLFTLGHTHPHTHTPTNVSFT